VRKALRSLFRRPGIPIVQLLLLLSRVRTSETETRLHTIGGCLPAEKAGIEGEFLYWENLAAEERMLCQEGLDAIRRRLLQPSQRDVRQILPTLRRQSDPLKRPVHARLQPEQSRTSGYPCPERMRLARRLEMPDALERK